MTCKTNPTAVVKIDLDISHIHNSNHMVGMDKVSSNVTFQICYWDSIYNVIQDE
jgi:hypothetical protein